MTTSCGYTIVINCGRNSDDWYCAEIILCIKPDADGLVPESLRSPREVMGEALTAEWGELEARFTPGRLIRWKSLVLMNPDRDQLEAGVDMLEASIRVQMG